MTERIALPNPNRLDWCMTDQGLTHEQLVREAGIKAETLALALTGAAALTLGQLERVAKTLGKGILFFLEPQPVDEASVHTPQFRTLTNQKPDLTKKIKQLIERAEQHRATFLALLAQADEPIKPFTPPELPADDLKTAALITRQWLGLDAHHDFAGFRSAIEAKGVLVFQSNGYKGDWNIGKDNPILGFSLYHDIYPVILIKKQDAVSREAFTLMHELAHLLLHKDSSIDDEHDLNANIGDEREANAFAGYLLVPDEALNTLDFSSKPDDIAAFDGWLAVYRKRWGVSSEVILRRLLDSRRLRQADYAAYREWRTTVPTVAKSGGNREWRHREPSHIFGEGYVNRVLQSLNHRDITLSKASSYLDNLKIPDLQMLERHYAA